MDNGVSAGEIGGVVAGLVALLAALGKGAQWIFNWKGAREDARAARLKAWEDSLDRRERTHREETEHELEQVSEALGKVREELGQLGRQSAEQSALLTVTRNALHLVTERLRQVAPDSPELEYAEVLLRPGFLASPPLPITMPPDMAELQRQVIRKDEP